MTRGNDGRCDFCDAEIPTYVKTCPKCGKKQLETVMDKRNWTDWDSEDADHHAEEAREKAGIGEIAEPAVIAQRLSRFFISAIPLFIFINILIFVTGAFFAFGFNAAHISSSVGIGAILMWGGGTMAALSGWGATYRPQAATASAPMLWSKTSSATKMSILNDFQVQQGHWILMGVYSLIIAIIGMAMY